MDGVENAIGEWRARMLGGDAMDLDTVRELESHLRDALETHIANGMAWEEAFEKAKQELGEAGLLNAEFGKVRPKVPWARRVLWIIAGYVVVQFAMTCVNFVGFFADWLVFKTFPEARVPLPVPVEIMVRPDNFWNDLPGGAHVIESVPLMSVVRIAVRLLVLAMVCWWGVRWRRGRTPRLDRWLGARNTLTKLALLLSLIAFLGFGSDWTYGKLFDPALYVSSIPGYYTMSALLWSLDTMARNTLFLAMIVLAASRRPRNGVVSDLKNWVFAGYFVVNGALMLATTLGSAVSVAVVRFVPSALEPTAMLDFWPFGFKSVARAEGLQVYLEILFLFGVLALVFTSLVQGGRFGSPLATTISRRWRSFLTVWCLWTFGWSTVGAILNYLSIADPNYLPPTFLNSWFGLSVLRLSNAFDALFWVFLMGLAVLAYVRGRPVVACHSDDLLDA